MPLEIVAVTLCVLTLFVAVAMLLIGFAGIADPTVITRCQDCSRWTMDTRHQGPPVCLRCRREKRWPH